MSSCSTPCRTRCYFHPNQFETMFLSTAHTAADIDVVLERFEDGAIVSTLTVGPYATAPAILSPEPILAAAETYRGTIFDLDSGQAVGPHQWARGRPPGGRDDQRGPGGGRPRDHGHRQRSPVPRRAFCHSCRRRLALATPCGDAAGGDPGEPLPATPPATPLSTGWAKISSLLRASPPAS